MDVNNIETNWDLVVTLYHLHVQRGVQMDSNLNINILRSAEEGKSVPTVLPQELALALSLAAQYVKPSTTDYNTIKD